jgi:hypothetical protein
MMNVTPSSPVAKLAVYGVLLAVALGGGAAAGAAFGPEPDDSSASSLDERDAVSTSDSSGDPAAGLGATQDGYHLALETATVPAGTTATLQFVIDDPHGEVLTTYDVEHDKELHLIVVSRDLRTFAHVHPQRDEHGTWHVDVPAMPAGPYRVYADFVPAGGDGITLATDLGVAGDFQPQPVPAPSRAATVDDYEVTFDGELVAGQESELTVTVRRDGEPVTDLDPYLGALGHLVAIRDGDLAYLHVHPLDELDGPGGPAVRFAVDVPTEGTYGLFFDFSHGGDVRTASVVASATLPTDDAPATETEHGHGG